MRLFFCPWSRVASRPAQLAEPRPKPPAVGRLSQQRQSGQDGGTGGTGWIRASALYFQGFRRKIDF